MGSLKETMVLAVAQSTFVLACFRLRLHLDNGLMQSEKHFFCFSCLLRVSMSLSRGKLNTCGVVLLAELGLAIM